MGEFTDKAKENIKLKKEFSLANIQSYKSNSNIDSFEYISKEAIKGMLRKYSNP